MSIIGTLPDNLVNGTIADASQVMADLNFIVNQVNANANPIGTLTAPTGTRVLFNQAAAPLGWTADTNANFDDCSVRLNTTTGGATGGSTVWSSWNGGGTFNLNAFTLSVAQLPAHSHADSGHTHTYSDPAHSHASQGNGFWVSPTSGGFATGSGGPAAMSQTSLTQAAGVGITIQNSFANIQNTGSGAAITPSYKTPTVKYTDCVIGIKS
jgi:hypothetical protein